MIPDIPEILGIERSVYGGQTPWDDRAFRSELMRKKRSPLLGFAQK